MSKPLPKIFTLIPTDQQFSLPQATAADIIVLPERITAEGVGLYTESAIDTLKELKDEGLNAVYLQEPDERKWIGRHGVPEPLIEFAVALTAEAAWYAIEARIRKAKAKTPVKAKIARCTDAKNKINWEWFEVEGTREDVLEAMDKMGPPKKDPK